MEYLIIIYTKCMQPIIQGCKITKLRVGIALHNYLASLINICLALTFRCKHPPSPLKDRKSSKLNCRFPSSLCTMKTMEVKKEASKETFYLLPQRLYNKTITQPNKWFIHNIYQNVHIQAKNKLGTNCDLHLKLTDI